MKHYTSCATCPKPTAKGALYGSTNGITVGRPALGRTHRRGEEHLAPPQFSRTPTSGAIDFGRHCQPDRPSPLAERRRVTTVFPAPDCRAATRQRELWTVPAGSTLGRRTDRRRAEVGNGLDSLVNSGGYPLRRRGRAGACRPPSYWEPERGRLDEPTANS